MRPQYRNLVAAGSSSPIRVNSKQADFNIGLALEVTGVASTTVEHSFSDPEGSDVFVWFPHSDLATKTVGNYDGNYAFHIQMSRITQTGTGTSKLTLIQGT